VFEIIGKGGKDLNPLPPENARKATAETDRAAGGDAMCERFEAEARTTVKLHLSVVNLLLEVAIGARRWSFERLRV